MIWRFVALGQLVLASMLGAQASPGVNVMLDRVRAATKEFEDRRFAIAAGYRRAGRDMPSMGEHWINPRLLMEPALNLEKPAVLTYLKVNGKPVLTGVVFAIPLAPGESPPTTFGASARWHEHNGSIDDEALLPEHDTAPLKANETRVAFLHAWINVPSPDGVFAAENWAIPFLRSQLPVPRNFTEAAARALSLATGGKEFFMDVLGPAAAKAIEPAIGECSAAVSLIVRAARSESRALTGRELEQLDSLWTSLTRFAADRVGTEVAAKLNGGAVPHVHHGSD